ncbi:MAG: DNA cytosine methyltransferase [Halobacteriota archaeon]|nr:DNA cytosine methyltransferase [Halobacteriota archaeon]
MKKILIACEFSGIVREAFKSRGHDAWSCDLLPSEIEGNHIQGDVLEVLEDDWDLMIAFPPCTYLTVSGNRWMKPEYRDRFPNRPQQREEAIDFFMALAKAPIPRIAIENPVGIMSTVWRKPDQIIQPYQFGHPETKKTCLWLKNLPLLRYTDIVEGREQRIWKEPPSKDRWKNRSRTYAGIAKAMATQWGAWWFDSYKNYI